ncbi:MAG: enoyl-CoA hydratase/isomerase family protein [Pseudomonadota bacterium]
MSEIIFETRGPIGLVTLNRPEQFNALTHDMVKAFFDQLGAWSAAADVAAVVVRGAGEAAFCAGGDVRKVESPADAAIMTAFFRDEYRLNRAIKRFSKPYVALMDGVTMGGGAGISVHGDYRVGGDRLDFAMPETGIGLIPDVGASFFLPRLPRRLGLHLGLTGARLDAADCVNAHLIDYYVRSERMEQLIEAMVAGDYSDDADETLCEILALNASAPGAPALKAHADEIAEAYGADEEDGAAQSGVSGVIAALKGGSAWAQSEAAALETRCPMALALAHRLLSAPAADVETALAQEYRAAKFCVERADFYEGVRALLVEKRAANWSPASLAAVSAEMVDQALAPLGADELSF